jgi:hypothetical protein
MLPGSTPVRDGRLGRGKHGAHSIFVTDVKEHPFGHTAYLPWLQVDHEQGLLADNFLRVGVLLLSVVVMSGFTGAGVMATILAVR